MQAQRIGQGAAHGLARIERGVGVLEDHLDGARGLQPLALAEVAAVERDVAVRRRDQAHDGERQGGLAAAGFAHQAQALAGLHVERDAVDGLQRVDAAGQRAADLEVDGEIVEREQRLSHDDGTARGRRPAAAVISGGTRQADIGRRAGSAD